MHYRKLERAKTLALIWKKGKYDKTFSIPDKAVEEIDGIHWEMTFLKILTIFFQEATKG